MQIDPLTLVITSLGTLAGTEITCIVQSGHDLYVSIGADLYVIHGASA